VSIQAVAWALEQDFSYTTPKGHVRCCHAAKLVLLSLANHADHVSGHCWPSAETIAREASCVVHSVYRLVAALERNGFIDIKKVKGPDGKQRSNNYWVRFDRKAAPWQFFKDDEPDDDSPQKPGDSEPGDTKSPGGNAATNDANPPSSESESGSESPGPSDIEVTRHIMLEPSELEPSVATAPTPPVSAPQRFDATARTDEQARLQAAEEARKPKAFPVIQGSAPWDAWVKHGHPNDLTGNIDVNGRLDRGWYFPTLWPPKETGPPAAIAPEDAKKAS
jgi:hypothetical protein